MTEDKDDDGNGTDTSRDDIRDALQTKAEAKQADKEEAARREGENHKTRMHILNAIAFERQRQIEGEGFDEERDDRLHTPGDLCAAGGCYAQQAAGTMNDQHIVHPSRTPPIFWPWDADWWKPKDAETDLVRAAALIVAELERIARTRHDQRLAGFEVPPYQHDIDD